MLPVGVIQQMQAHAKQFVQHIGLHQIGHGCLAVQAAAFERNQLIAKLRGQIDIVNDEHDRQSALIHQAANQLQVSIWYTMSSAASGSSSNK